MGTLKEEKVVKDRTVLGISNIGNLITDKWHTLISSIRKNTVPLHQLAQYNHQEFSCLRTMMKASVYIYSHTRHKYYLLLHHWSWNQMSTRWCGKLLAKLHTIWTDSREKISSAATVMHLEHLLLLSMHRTTVRASACFSRTQHTYCHDVYNISAIFPQLKIWMSASQQQEI
jgi:hypothetical protein